MSLSYHNLAWVRSRRGGAEHTGGKSESGADAICTYRDPFGVPNRIAVQLTMPTWDTDWTRPLKQLRMACQSYEEITSEVILSTSVLVTPDFEAARTKLQKEFWLPVRILLRRELLRLFILRVPKLVSVEAEPEADFRTVGYVPEAASRVFANALVNMGWRNGPIEDVHSRVFRELPLDRQA